MGVALLSVATSTPATDVLFSPAPALGAKHELWQCKALVDTLPFASFVAFTAVPVLCTSSTAHFRYTVPPCPISSGVRWVEWQQPHEQEGTCNLPESGPTGIARKFVPAAPTRRRQS